MSNRSPFGAGNRQQRLPTPPQGVEVAAFDTYAQAQRAVDHLSDEDFPVQHVTIVGTNLQMVERVTGRLTYARVAMAGAATGAWFGLFVGLLISLLAQGASILSALVPAMLFGAGFGMLFGVISYSFTGGRRDFTSTSQIVASRYAVLCADAHAEAARAQLSRMGSQAGDQSRSDG